MRGAAAAEAKEGAPARELVDRGVRGGGDHGVAHTSQSSENPGWFRLSKGDHEMGLSTGCISINR